MTREQSTEIELRGRLKALEEQRGRALTDHALLQGALAVAEAEKAELAREVERLAKVAEVLQTLAADANAGAAQLAELNAKLVQEVEQLKSQPSPTAG